MLMLDVFGSSARTATFQVKEAAHPSQRLQRANQRPVDPETSSLQADHADSRHTQSTMDPRSRQPCNRRRSRKLNVLERMDGRVAGEVWVQSLSLARLSVLTALFMVTPHCSQCWSPLSPPQDNEVSPAASSNCSSSQGTCWFCCLLCLL